MSMAERMKRLGAVKVDEADRTSRAAAPSAAKTAVGGNMILSAHLNSANQKIAELERQLSDGPALDVSLDELVEIPGRRRKLTQTEYEELRANLAKYPLTTPITVVRRGPAQFEVLSGHNRVAAYRDLGRTTIPACVLQIEDGLIEYAAFFSNLLSPTLSDFEKYWGFRALQAQSGVSQAELAKAAGISAQHVTRIMKFDDLPEEAKAILADRPERLGSAAAEQLIEAGRRHPERITEAIRALVADPAMTQAQAVSMVREKPQRVVNEPLVVRRGKKKFCEISVRGNVIGLKLGPDVTDAEQWAKRLHDFIAESVKAE
jgi:ParB family chromosome partitioning protein